MSTPKATALDAKMRLAWGDEQARKLWEGFYSRYQPHINGRVILDLGCSWGYMLRYLAQHYTPQRLIGIDVADLWTGMQAQWNYTASPVPIEFYQTDISTHAQIAPHSVDLVLCSSVLQYMPPDVLEASLNAMFALLKPGGEMIVRTRCFTSSIGMDYHAQFEQIYIHLLHNGVELAQAYKMKTGKTPRYLNYLTASSYASLFHRSGFEIMRFLRRMNNRDPETMQKVAQQWPWIEPEELNVAEVEAHLIRPLTVKQLYHFGGMAKSGDVKMQ